MFPMNFTRLGPNIRRVLFKRWTSSTASQLSSEEVKKFDNFGDWWSSEETKLLRTFNEVRIPLIVDNLTNDQESKNPLKPLEGFNVVDIGSGGGLVCEPLARLGAKVTGVDANANCIKYCEDRLSSVSANLKNNLSFFNGHVEDYVTQDKIASADAVIASEVLEHVYDVESVVQSCYKLLKPNGQFFITTINQTIPAYLLAIFGAENVLGLVPKGTHEYRMLVPLLSLKVMLEKNGFYVKTICGLKCNPFTSRWSWTRITDVNYAIVAQKLPDAANPT